MRDEKKKEASKSSNKSVFFIIPQQVFTVAPFNVVFTVRLKT